VVILVNHENSVYSGGRELSNNKTEAIVLVDRDDRGDDIYLGLSDLVEEGHDGQVEHGDRGVGDEKLKIRSAGVSHEHAKLINDRNTAPVVAIH